ncbi:MmgE/PrpD family protein [Chloroflexota bacterium]
MKQQDAAFDLAQNVIKTRFEDLPPEAIEATKNDILDTLGVGIAGTTAAAAKEVLELGREWGGKPESTIVSFGDKMPSYMAAFINGTMAHGLDFDDNHDKATLHVGPAVVSAAMAIAERVGNIDGKTFSTAVALGADLIIRMGLATKRPLHEGGFMFTPLYGYFGAAAASGKILGLDQGQMVNAFGIAYAQAAGNMQVNVDNEHALTKRLSVGFASKGGVMSALLAQKGLTGAQHSMEGRFGLFNLYQRGEYDRSILLKDLGKVFEIASISFKPYSCCRQIHAFADAARQLKRDYEINPDNIQSITVYINETAGKALCEPLDLRRAPQEEVFAQFSLPYNVGVALARGKVVINDFTIEAMKDPDVLAITRKITPKVDPALSNRKNLSPETAVEILMKDGTVLKSKSTVTPKGHPDNPMSWAELGEKFMDCVSHSAEPLSKGNVEKAIDLCAHLENVSDVSQIVRLLSKA